MGIEPTRPAWKAGILPLNYTRISTLYYYITFFTVCQALFTIFFKKFEPRRLNLALAFFRYKSAKHAE